MSRIDWRWFGLKALAHALALLPAASLFWRAWHDDLGADPVVGAGGRRETSGDRLDRRLVDRARAVLRPQAAAIGARAQTLAVMRRRQSWWYGLAQRPRDITGERWMRSTDVRADKPMPERNVVVERRSRRR